MLKEDFSNISVRSNSPKELLQGFKSLNVHIWVNGLTTWHNVYQNQPFCIPKMVAMIFQLKGVALNCFFQKEVEWCHSDDCLFVCRSKWRIHISSPELICDKKSFRHQPCTRRGKLNTLLSTHLCSKSGKLHGNQQPHKATQQRQAGHSKLTTEKKNLHGISCWFWLKYWKHSKTCGQTLYIVKPVSQIGYNWHTVVR